MRSSVSHPAAAMAAALVILCVAADGHPVDLQAVPHVDLDRFAGRWYETARVPNRYEKGCGEASWTFYPLPGDKVRVTARCRKGPAGDEVTMFDKTARIVGETTNAKWEIPMSWFFTIAYWIVELGPGYEYAVTVTPDRKYAWILSRSPSLEEPLYEVVLARLLERGFDTRRLKRVGHDSGDSGGPDGPGR